jgi:hypothetical protein
VHPFRVAINAKGGDCWHVYRNSVVFIDGNNNIDNGILVAMMENRKANMIASRIVVYKPRGNNAELHAEHNCVPGPR